MRRRRGPGLIGTAARTAVIAGTATAVSGKVAAGQQQKAMAQQAQMQAAAQQAAAQQAAAAAPAASAPAEPDYVAELERLAQLKQQGILTEEEFQAKKKQILGI